MRFHETAVPVCRRGLSKRARFWATWLRNDRCFHVAGQQTAVGIISLLLGGE